MKLFVCALAAWAVAAPSTAQPDWRPVMRKAIEKLDGGASRRNDYGFIRFSETKEYDSSGKLRNRSTVVTRTEVIDGFAVARLVERDGEPVSEGERAAGQEAINKKIAQLKRMTPEQRTKARQTQDAWLLEMADALNFRKVGEETYRSRPVMVFDCTPRPGYKPRNIRARVFEKMNGRIWLDKADGEIVKANAEMFDAVNIGFGILGRIEKGTQFQIERVKIDNAHWALERQRMKFNARVMLVKSMNREIELKFSDYKKYAK